MSLSIRPITLDIVIPSYNSESTIQICLNALSLALDRCNATGQLERIQIHIVDDGSTDRSPTIIREFITTSAYATNLINQSQEGPSSARNTGTRLGQATWILYIDSDVEIEPNSIVTLLKHLSVNPTLLAFNGYPNRWVPNGTWVTQYTNLSLCFQLKQHGTMVNSAFTSLCLMSREAWVLMNGWDASRRSRYSDDIQTRWHLPPNCIQQCFDVCFTHHKHVSFKGLLKHRFNLGFHYLNSLPVSKKSSPKIFRTLHSRYPLNVFAALSSIMAIVAGYSFHPVQGWQLLIPHSMWISLILFANQPLVRFTRVSTNRFQNPMYTGSIFGISYCEGFMMGLGLLFSLVSKMLNRTIDEN